MKAGLFSVASVTLLQLVVARAALHQNHQHLHDKRAPAVVYETVTDSEYVYYDSVDVIVYKDAQGKALSTVTSWKGQKQVSTSVSTSHTPPPPPPTTTSSSTPPPPPPPKSSSSAAPPPPAPAAEEKIAEPVHHHPPAHNTPPPSPPPQSSSPPSQPSGSSPTRGGGGGKGVAYNTPAQASQVHDITWACNWGQQSDLGGNLGFEYVPQLWGKKDGMCDSFSGNVASAGAKHALFYNEPDMPESVGGSGVDVGTATGDFITYMKPIQDKGVQVSSPCVANSNSAYLDTFLGNLQKQGASVDILCFHWYGNDPSGLKGTVETFSGLADKYSIKQLWLNEWAVQPAPDNLQPYVQVLEGAVDRYAYNMNDMEGSTGY